MRVFLTIACLWVLVSCSKATSIFAEGPISTRTEQFSGFNAVSVSGLDVDLHKGEHSKIEISVQQSVMPYIEAYVVDSVLYVKYQNGVLVAGNVKLNINITTQAVSKLESSNRGVISCNDIASSPKDRVLAPMLIIRADNCGSMTLYGLVNNLYVYGDDAQFRAGDLVVTDFADINLSKASTADFTLNGVVDANLSNRSTLTYKGSPTLRTIKISDDSSLIPVN